MTQPYSSRVISGMPVITFGTCATASINQHGNIEVIGYNTDAPDIAEIAELSDLLKTAMIAARPIWRQKYQTYGNATSKRRREYLDLICNIANGTWTLATATPDRSAADA